MMKDINELITIVKGENGSIKITQGAEQKCSMYKFLNEIGFYKTTINKRVVFFRKINGELFHSSFDEIRTTFWKKLENSEFLNIPSDINYKEILNWYLGKLPIKHDKTLNEYLNIRLNEEDEHILRMQFDHSYRNQFNITQLLTKFEEWGFKKTIDNVDSDNTPLYYKKVSEDKYLVFRHYYFENKKRDGFDCSISTFAKESLIGKKQSLKIQDIKLGFIFERDINLIRKFLE
ncbi:MAG: hypothetical protein A2066_10950 [Bacteroidetes bacterium GWB2_41_8]|nr:MAG: hypothetical protein A2066_10950 [Bacteroidetes bacterium GWB2_41_8]